MHRIAVAAIAAALSITGLIASPALATTPAPGHQWQVQAGSQPIFDSAGPRGAGNRFYPDALAIHQGDSVTFTPFGPHTVTYNRPPGPIFAILFDPRLITASPATLTSTSGSVNGPIGFGPPTPFVLTFASSGLYKIICGLHIGMAETVDVLPTGATLTKGDADYAAIAQAQITRDLASVDRIAAEATEDFEDEDGNVKVFAGAGNARVSNIRFFPAEVTVRVGNSVTFLKTQDPTEPHTVSFNLPPPDPNNPIGEFIASGGSRFDGTGIANSGFMSTKEQYAYYQLTGTPLPVARTRYRLTFTKVGDYPYVCAIHDGAGMVGIVHVVR
jgi:plastocyanin